MNDTQHLRTNVRNLCRGFVVTFAVMTVWLAYWHVVRAPALRADTHNPRASERLKVTQPGQVLTSDGQPILTGARSQAQWYVDYPEPDVYCHITGYNTRTGIQSGLRDAMYGMGKYEDPWSRILRGRPAGCEIRLTINAKAQRVAARMMHGQAGAVFAVDPRNGAIRVMVSAPAYDPTQILTSAADYDLFRMHPDKPELNRALLGQYAPGSVLKVLTAAAAIDQGAVTKDDEFQCSGTIRIAGDVIRCRRKSGHGTISFTEAMTDSCNVIFADVGRGLGASSFLDYVNRFHLLAAPDLPLPTKSGRMSKMEGKGAAAELAEAAFGQGATLVTPAAIAQMTATIAAGGSVPKLKLVEAITSVRGTVYDSLVPESLGEAVSQATASTVGGMMVEVVERGTGRSGRISGVKVAGKTGSAQNPNGPAHAWFTAYAPADAPQIAVAVVVEHGGSGSSVAGPIARAVIRELLNSS